MPLSVRLKKDQLERLESLAKKTNRTKSFYISKALDEYLGELEFIYLMEQRMIDIRSGKAETVSHEEVMRRNGLLD